AVYRFATQVEPDKTARLLVREEQRQRESAALSDLGPDQITFYLRSRERSDRGKQALQEVVQLRDRLQRTQAHRGRPDPAVAAVGQEQSRLRETLARLPQSSERVNR